MLYRLTGLEITVFQKEYRELEKRIKSLRKILGNEQVLLQVIKDELIELMEKYGDDRRTEIIHDESEAKIDVEELIVVEDTMITMSNEGFIKRIPLKSYNRSNTDEREIDYREGDFNKFLFPSNTKDTVLFFTDLGNMYQTKGMDIPEYKWRERGEKLDTIIRGLDLSKEKVVAAYSFEELTADKTIMFITNKGYIKRTSLDKFVTNYTKLLALRLKKDESLLYAEVENPEQEINFIKLRSKLGLSFTVRKPELDKVERNVLGVELCPLGDMDELTSIEFVENYEFTPYILGISKDGLIKRLEVEDIK